VFSSGGAGSPAALADLLNEERAASIEVWLSVCAGVDVSRRRSSGHVVNPLIVADVSRRGSSQRQSGSGGDASDDARKADLDHDCLHSVV
jgi:hypothetical protein